MPSRETTRSVRIGLGGITTRSVGVPFTIRLGVTAMSISRIPMCLSRLTLRRRSGQFVYGT